MDNPILYQAIGGLVIVFFLVSIYYFTRTWRWFHIVCVSFVFFAAIVLLRNTAMVFRTWNAWRSLETKTTKMAEEMATKNHELRFGKYDDVQQREESSRLLLSKIGRVILDRGRVWRNCVPGVMANDLTVTVSTVPPGPELNALQAPGGAVAPAAGGAPPANRIQEQTVIYVFREDVPPPETGAPPGVRLPHYYIGDFVAVAVTDTTVTLRPLSPLSDGDRRVMRLEKSTWTLYETLPVDGHVWFTTDPDQKPTWTTPADDAPVFGTINETAIKALFAWPRFTPDMFVSPEQFQNAVNRLSASVQDYLRDGKRATDADLAMNRWLKVRFVKAHKEVVDSGAAVSPFAPGVTDDFYDRGLAEIVLLQLGKEAEFKPGDIAIFPSDDANQLINQGICELIEPVFVRRLDDYIYLFANFNRRLDRVINDTARIQRDIVDLQQSQEHVNMQLAQANDEMSKLKFDLQKTQDEEQKIAAYLVALEKKWAETRAALSYLYRTNLQLEEELEQRSRELTEEINRRTLEAIADK